MAKQHDWLHDPANNEISQAWWDEDVAIDEKMREIVEWEGMHHHGIPSEAKLRSDTLTRTRRARSDGPPSEALRSDWPILGNALLC